MCLVNYIIETKKMSKKKKADEENQTLQEKLKYSYFVTQVNRVTDHSAKCKIVLHFKMCRFFLKITYKFYFFFLKCT